MSPVGKAGLYTLVCMRYFNHHLFVGLDKYIRLILFEMEYRTGELFLHNLINFKDNIKCFKIF